MPDENIVAVHQVRILGTNHAGQTVNVLNFGQTVTIFDDFDALSNFLTTLAEAMMECVVDALIPALPSDWVLNGVDARQIKPTISDPVIVRPETVTVGSLTASEPGQIAQLLAIYTGTGGRRGRGRIFLPPPPEGGVDQSSLTSAQLALLVAFGTCLATKFIGSGRTFAGALLGVFSRVDMAASNNINTAFRQASKITVRGDVATMRSRKKGVGS